MIHTAFESARLVSRHTPAVLQLVSAYVATVQARHVGSLMAHLRTALPPDSLQHLKRVRKLQTDPQHAQLLLCALSDLVPQREQPQPEQLPSQQQQQQATEQSTEQQQQQYPDALPQATRAALASCQAQVTVQQVPAGPPDNRQQWKEWCELWPMPYK